MTTTFVSTFKAERARRATNGHVPQRKQRTPILVHLGRTSVAAARFAARRTPRWSAVRTAVLQLVALGCISTAAWMVAVPLGLFVAGASLLVLEALSGPART